MAYKLPEGWMSPGSGAVYDPNKNLWTQLTSGGWYSADADKQLGVNPWEFTPSKETDPLRKILDESLTPASASDINRFQTAFQNRDPNFANYWSLFGDFPAGGTDADKAEWIRQAQIGGGLERIRQDTVASDKWTNLIEGGLLAAGTAAIGGLGLGSIFASAPTMGAIAAPVGLAEEAAMLGLGDLFTAPALATGAPAALGAEVVSSPAFNPSVLDHSFLGTTPTAVPNLGTTVWGLTPGTNMTGTLPGFTDSVGVLDKLYGGMTGYGGLSQSALAQMIEGGAAGAAGLGLEGLSGAGTGVGLKGIVSSIPSSIGGGKMGTANTLLDVAKLGSALYGNYERRDQARQLQDALSNLNTAGPMGDRSWAVNELKRSYTDPWVSPEAQAYRRDLLQATKRAGAARGINPIHVRLAAESQLAKFLDDRRKTLAGIAGAEFNPAAFGQNTLLGLGNLQALQRGGTDQITAAIGDVLKGRGTDLLNWLMG